MRYLSFLAPAALLFVFSSVSAAAPAAAETYEIDAGHTTVGFQVRHMGVSNVVGRFGAFEGKVTLDSDNLKDTSAEITIDVSSVYTGLQKRDDHLRNADFFDVDQHAQATFKSTGTKNVTSDGFDLTGNLTLLGVTKPVTLKVSGLSGEVEDPWGGVRRGATATATIKRSDYGMTFYVAEGVVGDEVKLNLEVELMRKK